MIDLIDLEDLRVLYEAAREEGIGPLEAARMVAELAWAWLKIAAAIVRFMVWG